MAKIAYLSLISSLLLSCYLVYLSGFQARLLTPRSSLRRDLRKKLLNPQPDDSQQLHRNIRKDARYERIVELRAGATTALPVSVVTKFVEQFSNNPTFFFNSCLTGLASLTLIWRYLESRIKSDPKSNPNTKEEGSPGNEKPAEIKSLQSRFLIVFWLLRMADWLQGPYFYEVYSSKIINGVPLSMEMVSKLFLIGFASTGIFGPFMGQFVDSVGRKAGTLLYTILYALGALSTQSNNLLILVLGRLCGGLGTSLLFSAPEAWLVGEFQKLNAINTNWLGQTFGWAYSGDSLVAITAGQLASLAAGVKGPTGPFTISVGFLATAAALILVKWKENKATTSTSSPKTEPNKPKIGEALKVMLSDPKIILLGLVQALFEGAMYIFVLQWPPAIKAAIQTMPAAFQQTVKIGGIPFGNIFSCFMASCLLGSTLFSSIQKSKLLSIEASSLAMLFLSAFSMGITTWVGQSNFYALISAFFLFELCVGLYFPSIGTLRSKYIPDSHRSVIMNLFGIPLNLIVVSVFLSIRSLGMAGAFTTATAALSAGTLAMFALWRSTGAFAVNNYKI